MFRFSSILALVTVLLVPLGAQASAVSVEHKGLNLNANLEMADGKAMKDGVVLILHGTLAHGGMELVVALQELLKEREISSLAMTLSLGQDNRKGMYACATTHTYLHSDSLDELTVWLDWLQAKGASNVTVLGHSRGAGQVAWFAAERSHPIVRRVISLAPGNWSKEKRDNGYKKNYKKGLWEVFDGANELVKAGKGSTVLTDTDMIYCPKTSVTAAAFVSEYNDDNAMKDSPTTVAKTKLPLLVILGSEDTVNPGMKPQFEPLADGKRISLVEVEEAGHFFRDLFGEDVADAVQEFIASAGS